MLCYSRLYLNIFRRRLTIFLVKFESTLSLWRPFSPRMRSFNCPLQILRRTAEVLPPHWCVLSTLEGLLSDRRMCRCSCSVIRVKIPSRMPCAGYGLWNFPPLGQNWGPSISPRLVLLGSLTPNKQMNQARLLPEGPVKSGSAVGGLLKEAGK